VFATLNEHWNEFPNLVEQYPEPLLDRSTRVNGNIHGICHVVPQINRFLGIRTDWLEAVDMEPPTDLDELMELSRAFTFEDPDGDGKDNTWAFGLDATLAEPLWFLGSTFRLNGITADALYPVAGGRVEASIWQPGFKEFVGFLRDAYAEGVINPESLTFTRGGSQIETDLFWPGKTGMTGVLSGSISKWEIQLRENYPEASILLVEPLDGPYGEPVIVQNNDVWRNYVITSAVDDRQLLKAMAILDWIVSEEGAHFLAYGQEGVHWNETNEAGIPIVTDKWHSDRWANIWRQPNRPQASISIIRPSERANEYGRRMLDHLDEYGEYAIPHPVYKLSERPASAIQVAELTPMLRSAVLKVVTQDEPMSHLDAVVEEINRRGLTAAVQDINRLLEAE
jgi:ABC-type glycerol-3-phosphate transport system substrate-binding protein